MARSSSSTSDIEGLLHSLQALARTMDPDPYGPGADPENPSGLVGAQVVPGDQEGLAFVIRELREKLDKLQASLDADLLRVPGHVGETFERVGGCRTAGSAPLRAQDVVRHADQPRQRLVRHDIPSAPGHVERLRHHILGIIPAGVAPSVREHAAGELLVQLTDLGRHTEYCPRRAPLLPAMCQPHQKAAAMTPYNASMLAPSSWPRCS